MTTRIVLSLVLLFSNCFGIFVWSFPLASRMVIGRSLRATFDDAVSDPAAATLLEPPELMVIIPAYNEELRIRSTLETYRDYFENSERWKDKTTILVVDDGSSDSTSKLVCEMAVSGSSSIPLECFTMSRNEGKGSALAKGIAIVYKRCPTGLILTADADGSASIADVEVLYRSMERLIQDNKDVKKSYWSGPFLVNGYRTYESASASRLVFRWGFRTVVRTFCGDLGVNDSQCGFKLMTTSTATALYTNLNLLGWSHDVEVFYRAQQLGIPITEEPIHWEDKDGSKLVSSPGGVIAVSSRMFWEVLRLRIAYESGAWKI
jgi:dolichyl-phosphate beta-glucosyltransferase